MNFNMLIFFQRLNFNRKSSSSERGSVLIYSLLILIAIMIVSITLMRVFIPKLKLASQSISSTVALYSADSALEWCLYRQRGNPDAPAQPTTIGSATVNIVFDGTELTTPPPVYDNFNRANGGLGSDWIFFKGSNEINYPAVIIGGPINGHVEQISPPPIDRAWRDSWYRRSEVLFPQNQYAQIVVTDTTQTAANNEGPNVIIRAAGSGSTARGYFSVVGSGTARIYKLVNGNPQSPALLQVWDPGLAINVGVPYTVRLAANNNTLTLTKDAVSFSVTDNTAPYLDGSPGITISALADGGEYQLDDYESTGPIDSGMCSVMQSPLDHRATGLYRGINRSLQISE